MIAIDRTRASAPPELVSEGAHDLVRIEPLANVGTLESKHFKKSIYSSEAVRTELWKMQHHKCCFCEHVYEKKFSTVEHFRPKTSSRNQTGQTEAGYWWLGYEFENLYFCCSNCNTPKSNWFPINNGVRYKHPELPWVMMTEDPLVLDPGAPTHRPEDHLSFVRHPEHNYWRIAALDDYGSWTIRSASLDRDDLNELRDAHYIKYLLPIVQAAQGDANLWDMARKIAHKYCEPEAPFSLLARAVFAEARLV